jgi:hypothetical protein
MFARSLDGLGANRSWRACVHALPKLGNLRPDDPIFAHMFAPMLALRQKLSRILQSLVSRLLKLAHKLGSHIRSAVH